MDLVNILIVWGVDLLFLLSALSHLTWLVSKVSALDCEIILTGTLFLKGLWGQVIREHSFKEDLGCCGKFLEALSSREFFKLNSQSLPFVLLVYCLPLPLLSFPSLFLLSFSILSYFLSFFFIKTVWVPDPSHPWFAPLSKRLTWWNDQDPHPWREWVPGS